MRKPVLLVDDSNESLEAIRLLKESGQPYVEYYVKKFDESCCSELPTTRAPSVFAPEGVFKGLEGIRSYLATEKLPDAGESAYW